LREPKKLEIVPHPKAPWFQREDSGLILKQLVDEIEGGKFNQSNGVLMEFIRQAGYVSLWFFLKCICGVYGPFDLLTNHLHVDMCNVRQLWLFPGARGAMFLPRGHYKSTIVTEGGSAWELLRNPDLRIRISNATADRAANFMHTVKDIFEFDGFVRELYPEYCPKDKNQSYWNNKYIVMPNRTKRFREPSLEAGGIGGSSEGHHYDLHIIDDMIGKKALNAMRQCNVVMEETKNWFWGSDSLLVAPAKSRTLVVGTRWGVDDVYSEIIQNARANLGFPIREFIPNQGGEYVVYYRKAIEDGEIIFPENFTQEFFDRMANSGPDGWWEYVTQYLNDPYESSLTDLSGYDLKKCRTFYGDDDMWYVEFDGQKEPLCDFDVVQAGDPAATEKYISARTSRSSQGIVATHHTGKVFLISLHVGFVSPLEFFDWLFTDMEKFERYIRATYLETQGPFKIMGPLLREEEQKRRLYLKLWPSSATGDKDGRIRSTLDPIMSRGDLYVSVPYFDEVRIEQKSFPQSSRKDILDMLTLGVSNSTRPFTPEEEESFHEQDSWWANRTRNIAGY
jgi:hypothetical protein